MITKTDCQRCRKCCKFDPELEYFAPLFFKKDITNPKIFQKYKDSKDIVQVRLVQSKKNKHILVCPFLDEDSHLCKIYSKRPIDCRIWPFVLMKKDGKIVLAYFDKDSCPVTERMNEKEFTDFGKRLISDIKNVDKERLNEIAWDYEEGVTEIKSV